MEELVLKMVQGQIGYTFENLDLLKQAFTRRSYTEENGGENNEVLEFIGDKALDFAVVRLLTQKFGYMANGDPIDGTKVSEWEQQQRKLQSSTSLSNEFVCDQNEGQLTKIKSRMVEKRNLSRRIEELGFAEHLIMGNSDIQNNVQEEMSVKEDLFEAIVGAVTLDCRWDFSIITSVVEAMLIPEDFFQSDIDTNYVRLIQEWEMQKNGVIPWYLFKEASYTSTWYMYEENTIYQHFPWNYNYSKLKYHCYLKLLDSLPVFCGFGSSKSEARMNVCKLSYEYLQEHNLLFSIHDEIENPNKADAINQLEILARRGYFSLPTYDFEQEYDPDGNPVWKCECHIEEYDIKYCSKSSSKKDAKKTAAFEILKYVLSQEE